MEERLFPGSMSMRARRTTTPAAGPTLPAFHARHRAAIACALLCMAMGSANAGRSCVPTTPKASTIAAGMTLAERTSQALDASGARVVVLARAGQDLTKYGLRYSHLGFAYRSAEGPWRVLHKLNQCGAATGALYRQGLGEFFLDDLWRHEAAWLVPTDAMQAQLMAVLDSPERLRRLHSAPYSVVSYAWGRKYQQSNQWAIETLASAVEPAVQDRRQAQAWLQLRGYEPTTLRLGPLERLGGRVGSANIAFDDHPGEKRFTDRIETVTVDSVFTWMTAQLQARGPERLKLDELPIAAR